MLLLALDYYNENDILEVTGCQVVMKRLNSLIPRYVCQSLAEKRPDPTQSNPWIDNPRPFMDWVLRVLEGTVHILFLIAAYAIRSTKYNLESTSTGTENWAYSLGTVEHVTMFASCTWKHAYFIMLK